MATNNGSGIAAPSLKVKCELHWWGEIYKGTKEALQSIGIGDSAKFPTTRSTVLRVMDPRGLPCWVSLSYGSDVIFTARVAYPERERPVDSHEYAPGVVRREETYGDAYVGTEEALVAARLVLASQLPGSPGMRKTKVDLEAADLDRSPYPLQCVKSIFIRRRGKHRFEMFFRLSDQIRGARRAEEAQWESKWKDAPRPRSLTWREDEAKQHAFAEQEEVARIRKLPATKKAYRESVASAFLFLAEKCVEKMKPQYGYRYEEDDIQEFCQAVSDLYWGLKEGSVIGLGPAGEMQRVMTLRARNNEPLQAFLSSVKAKA